MPRSKAKKTGKIPGIGGRGGYYSDTIAPNLRKIVPSGTFAKVGKMAGGKAAGMLPAPGSNKIGSSLGGYLGGKLAQILGFGSYTVKANTLLTEGGRLSEGQEIPMFKNYGHETRVSHREFLGELVTPASPTVFNNTTYRINAANPVLFPWLAPIASNYQQYRFNGLVVEFKTLSSDITAGGALGSVILATNYDVVDVPFSTKITMENSEYAISAKPSLSQLHAVECDPEQVANNLYYCRSSADGSSTADARFYDLGLLQIATSGLPSSAGTVLGELWISYDVSLLKPIISSTISSGSMTINSGGTVTSAVPFGSAPTPTGNTLAIGSGSTLTWPYPGTYYVSIQWIGTGFANPTVSGTASAVLKWTEFPRPGTLTAAALTYNVTVTAANQTTVFDFTTTTTTTASGWHIIACPVSNLL
jgi:hypothetical protein